MRNAIIYFATVFFIFFYIPLNAQICNAGSASISLDINNVKATLSNGGEIWFDQAGGGGGGNPAYQVPKSGQVHSIYAGSMWIGGLDQGNTLRIAAQTYRQNGSDFWPGPLDNTASTTQTDCNLYNRHWKVNFNDISTLQQLVFSNGGNPISVGSVPQSILEWPAKGNQYAKGTQSQPLAIASSLAPFVDVDSNGTYDPTVGDYPDIIGDQGVFWVYNDNGNTHTETGGEAIGIEVHALAYAYSTNNFLNNATFYRLKIINKSINTLDSTYVGIFLDTDLGCYDDDYIGCDPSKNMGIAYNGQSNDNSCGNLGYGSNPPQLGLKVLNSAYANLGDGIDNDGDNVIDEGNNNADDDNDNLIDEPDERERLGMTGFITYFNDFTVQGNPQNTLDYYRYLKTIWRDDSPLTKGGDGYGGNTITNFMYPGDPSMSNEWSECVTPNVPGDRRMLISSGPFTFESGSIESLDFVVLWNRPSQWVACSSFDTELAILADSAENFYNEFIDTQQAPDDTTTGIVDLRADLLNIFPNPASDALYFVSNELFESYTLYDLNGKKVQSGILNLEGKIDIRQLNRGLYFGVIHSKQNNQKIKFVVQ